MVERTNKKDKKILEKLCGKWRQFEDMKPLLNDFSTCSKIFVQENEHSKDCPIWLKTSNLHGSDGSFENILGVDFLVQNSWYAACHFDQKNTVYL